MTVPERLGVVALYLATFGVLFVGIRNGSIPLIGLGFLLWVPQYLLIRRIKRRRDDFANRFARPS